MLGSTSSAKSTGAPVMTPSSPEQVETPAEARAIETIAANLQIQAQPAHLFTIGFSSSSPDLSASLANALATEYTSENPERRLERLQDQLKTVADRVVELNAQID